MAILFAKTKQGTVEGKPGWNRAISVFKGIPFAAPPTGQNRWRAPQPPAGWRGIRKCFDYGPIPYQNYEKTEHDVLVSGIETFHHPIEEDCLYLNIWTPAETPESGLPWQSIFTAAASIWITHSRTSMTGKALRSGDVFL